MLRTTTVAENIGPNIDSAKWLLERDDPEKFAMPYLKTGEQKNLSKVDITIVAEVPDEEEVDLDEENKRDIY